MHPSPDFPFPPFGGPGGAGPHRGRRHRRGPGGPPGFGFPPGGSGPGGLRGRRGRRTSRGDIRLAVLALVAEQPMHGYEVIAEIGKRTGGRWRPSPGSVYPTLSQLEDEGLVQVDEHGRAGRKVLHLTDAGTAYVTEHRAEIDAVWASVSGDEPGDDEAADLWEQLMALHAAAQQVVAAGTPAQVSAATAAVTETRKALYRLLAE